MTVLVNEANIGAAGNWNRALELASGKYFKLLCADDYLYPECIETQVAALEDPANAAACMASARRDIVDARGRRIATRGFKGGGRLYAGREIIRRSIRRGTNIIGEPPCVLLRTETVGKKGGFDGSNPYLIDFDYWCRILLDGEIVMLDGPLSAFRVSKKSWSFDLSRRQADSFRRFAKKLPALGDIGLGGMDRLSCSLMAGVNEFMRCLFYKFFL
jgi:glycosyltransferase involved in cell wall biosynthesis